MGYVSRMSRNLWAHPRKRLLPPWFRSEFLFLAFGLAVLVAGLFAWYWPR